jgi:steroid delta-isomerase-like uncharacterized protein
VSVEENRAVAHRALEEVWNKGNLDVADEVYAAEFVQKDTSPPANLQTYKWYISSTRAAFPDLHITLEEVIAEGDKVVTRFSMTGTHRGMYSGLLPTGRKVTVSGVSIGRFKDGKIVELWGLLDRLSMLEQLGFVVSPG